MLTADSAAVSLRPWAPSDAPALRRIHESTPDLSTQLGEADLSSDEQAQQFLATMLGFGDTAKNWAIVADGDAVGNVGLAAIEWHHATAWAYYWTAASVRGRGYASLALRTVADHALRSGLERLELGHRVNNPASCRVATRAGFVAEGSNGRNCATAKSGSTSNCMHACTQILLHLRRSRGSSRCLDRTLCRSASLVHRMI